MSDIEKEIGKEIGKEIVKQGYNDISPAVKETAGTVETIVGFLNDVALYPLQKARIIFQYKLKDFERDLEEKYNKIPEENRIEPPILVLGPTIEGLKYTIDEEELRKMFVNLLSSSMNSETVSKVHPSYVEIVKQLGVIEAEILKLFVFPIESYPISEVVFKYKGKPGNILINMPKLFAPEFFELGDPFAISSAFENLNRLGLLTITFTKWFKDEIYEDYKKHQFVNDLFNQMNGEDNNIAISVIPGSFTITDFGKRFIDICIDKEEILNAN